MLSKQGLLLLISPGSDCTPLPGHASWAPTCARRSAGAGNRQEETPAWRRSQPVGGMGCGGSRPSLGADRVPGPPLLSLQDGPHRPLARMAAISRPVSGCAVLALPPLFVLHGTVGGLAGKRNPCVQLKGSRGGGWTL